jgi:hypothetical protein
MTRAAAAAWVALGIALITGLVGAIGAAEPVDVAHTLTVAARARVAAAIFTAFMILLAPLLAVIAAAELRRGRGRRR